MSLLSVDDGWLEDGLSGTGHWLEGSVGWLRMHWLHRHRGSRFIAANLGERLIGREVGLVGMAPRVRSRRAWLSCSTCGYEHFL